MHSIPTPTELADVRFVEALSKQKDSETMAAEATMELFKRDRGVEMKRVVEEVVKPHLRFWAKQWFHSHGLDVSGLPDVPAPEPAALVG